jgi:hypothetical protein
MYEALIMFVIISFILLNTMNIIHNITMKTLKFNKIINTKISNNYQESNCDYRCLIKKAF